MLDAYTEWTERARQFLADTGLVTFPDGETCAVVPSPVFQRPVLGVASYIARPRSATAPRPLLRPVRARRRREEEIQERLSNNSYGSIPTTSVHEAYPGHHWHLVQRKTDAVVAVRKVYGTPYFTEGWALYAERVMRERGFFTDPLHELQHLSATIFRAAGSSSTPRSTWARWTFDEAVAFMRDKAALPEAVAVAEVGRYCWWPTQASSYLTGCLEILEIRRRYLDARGFAGVARRRAGRGAARLPRHDRRGWIAAAGPRGSRGHGLARPTVDRVPLILDVDTGIDDALALLYAAASPEAELVAVTCLPGNAALADVARNTRAVLELAGRGDVEVAAGGEAPLRRPLEITPRRTGRTGSATRSCRSRPSRRPHAPHPSSSSTRPAAGRARSPW